MNRQHAKGTSRFGQAMTEFALLLPAMLFIMTGIFEAGRFFYTASSLANAAREGVRYGITHPTDSTGIRARVINSSRELGVANDHVQIVCTPSCAFGNQMEVVVVYTYQSITFLLPDFEIQRQSAMRIVVP